MKFVKSKYFKVGSISVIVICIIIFFGRIVLRSTNNIVFIRNAEVVEKFSGTLESKAIYQNKYSEYQGKLDTLNISYKNEVAEYQMNKGKMNATEKQMKETKIQILYTDLQKYSNAVEKKMQQENDKLMGAVLNQINSYAEQFAENHQYDIIIGTTSSGNLMYGAKKLDVTNEFIEELNEYYKKK